MNIHVISTGYNCAEYIHGCNDSVIRQKVNGANIKHWIVSDGSTDETKYFTPDDNRTMFILRSDRRGAAYLRWWLFHSVIQPDPNDIIVLLGLDDELLDGSLKLIHESHVAGNWVTYGNWVNQNGVPFKMIPNDNTTRSGAFVFTAPNTFRAGLFARIPEDRIKVNGEFQFVCTEVEVMYSCVEMAGFDRVKPIKELIYMYRQKLPNGTIKQYGSAFKNSIHEDIKKRDRMKRIEEL